MIEMDVVNVSGGSTLRYAKELFVVKVSSHA